MPVSLTRLRIAGFKSFAEPVNLEIRPGLTGIVGPNGCGKSNVVEALRWVMGESSARSLRGGEMDDVIFAGTAHRAGRDLAEVSLGLEETVGVVPPPFHEQPELEVIRRIQRGVGSHFRVNGKEVRARDVTTLFADLASGARSSGMVSQGRVSALVSAKPEDRRQILEEAAGISGLHARRHEAELKLRAAEANLARADDLVGQLNAQLDGLKRQARQANRYRAISGLIRAAEAELLALQRARVDAARQLAQAALAASRDQASRATEQATASAATATDAAAVLPALRLAEGDARTALERARLAGEGIAADLRRVTAALEAADRAAAQVAQDLGHAGRLEADAAAAERRLAAEDSELGQAEAGHPAQAERAAGAVAEAADRLRAAEQAAQQATEQAAENAARAAALAQAAADAAARLKRVTEAEARLATERTQVDARLVEAARLDATLVEQESAGAGLAEAREALTRAEAARAAAQEASRIAREQAGAAEAARAKLAAEVQGLAAVLAVKDNELWPPLVDTIDVPEGLEAALGAALGEELESAADTAAARHWRALDGTAEPGAPEGCVPLGALMAAPPVLARALARIFLLEEESRGDALQAALPPGGMLVSRRGGLWRWDGYTVRAGAPTAAAVRLAQRNRLAGLRARLRAAEAGMAEAKTGREQAAASEARAAAAEQHSRVARRDAEQRLERARAAAASLRAQAEAASTRAAVLAEQAGRLDAERHEAEQARDRLAAEQAGLPDLDALRAAVAAARAVLSAARASDQAARAEQATLAREQERREARRSAIGTERQDWAQRAADATGRMAELTARRDAALAERAALADQPAALSARRGEAIEALEAAEAAHRREAGALAAAEDAANRADRASRAAEAALVAAREGMLRAEAAMQQADHAWGTVAERILERLGANPALPDPPALPDDAAEEKAHRRLERLQREREEMGPVNLRAETEAAEIEARVGGIATERAELTTAIARLRGSIGHLNKEGRERLAEVFQRVDRHFQELFSRMFGGGKAHLALVGSDDPLEAGLEIYAQPPGKKLASLSLLSGGEQALTALSLIFAIFRCNPAPVGVLDEVDAPLDDANVDRFCTLLDEMVRATGTRFLVVTHHPLTMARMDRLYGVTMQERGVSRLLSVDLQRAANMVGPTAVAAE